MVDLAIAQQPVRDELGDVPIAFCAWGCHGPSFRVRIDHSRPRLEISCHAPGVEPIVRSQVALHSLLRDHEEGGI